MKYFNFCSLFFAGLIALSFLFSVNKVFAETEIYGGDDNGIYHISADTTWTKDASPYVVYSDVEIDSGATLIIEPGTIIKFDNWNYLDIYGKLIVNGTASEKVYFTSLYNDDDLVLGDTDGDEGEYLPEDNPWGGFEVYEGGSYEMNNAEISYADYILLAISGNGFFNGVDTFDCKNGIFLSSGGIDISNSTFVGISNDFIEAYSTSTVSFSSSSLKNISGNAFNIIFGSTFNLSNSSLEDINGNQVFEIFNDSSANIDGLSIKGFDGNYVLELFNNSSVNIINSTIEDSFVYDAFEVFNNSHLTFTNSTLKNTFGGPAISFFDGWNSSGSTLDIIDSIIDGGTDVGLEIFRGTTANIKNTKIINFFSDGIQAFSDPIIRISDSEISGNENGIQSWGADIEIKNSVIKDNTAFGIYNEDPYLRDGVWKNQFPINAVGNWWGDSSGPYNELTNASGTAGSVSGNVLYSPWLISDPNKKKNPVIIIPGIMSSYLNRNSYDHVEVWLNLAKALIPGDDSYLDELTLDEFGQPDLTHSVSLPTDIFREIGGKKFFGGLINELKNSGYVENEDLFVFPYDWRLDIRDSVDNSYSPLITSLKDKIDKVLLQTGAEKVDIIAHSMGGLLSKYYIEHYGQGKIDKFIDIATPHLGAPSALKALTYGDDIGIKLGFLGLNPLKVQEISQNFPSAYQLLPSQNYFSTSSPDYNYYVYDMGDYDGDGVTGRLSYDQTKEFLKNTGRNSLVMDSSIDIHDDLDNVNPADFGVQAYNIVGCGTPTLGKIFTLGKQNDEDPQYDIAYISGDGTVPQRSAEAMPSLKQYYVSKVDHGTMPSTNGIKELVNSILLGVENNFNYASSANVSTTTDDCKLPNGTFLSFHSPVALHIYDSFGNHAGPNTEGDLEENIPDIAYDIIDGNKFAYLPDGHNYRIELKATESGSFSSHIKKIENGNIVSTSYFNDIPLAGTSTTAEIDMESLTPEIILDITGDGTVKEVFQPSSFLIGDSLTDGDAPITEIKIISPAISPDGWYSGDVKINFVATDTDSGVLKTEYSINGGDYLETTLGILISLRGEIKVSYRSVDKAGNIENQKEIILKIKNIVHGRRKTISTSDSDIVASTSTLSPSVFASEAWQTIDASSSSLPVIASTARQSIETDSSSSSLVIASKAWQSIPVSTSGLSVSPQTGKVLGIDTIYQKPPSTSTLSSSVFVKNEVTKQTIWSNLLKIIKDGFTFIGKKLFKM
ncbi:MAG: hypothetical protein NTU76_03315 [Candidatus Taylorbacteria bacterium]|nr:hypothetical protein [Candidatus Taylorbacteria bacterium]